LGAGKAVLSWQAERDVAHGSRAIAFAKTVAPQPSWSSRKPAFRLSGIVPHTDAGVLQDPGYRPRPVPGWRSAIVAPNLCKCDSPALFQLALYAGPLLCRMQRR